MKYIVRIEVTKDAIATDSYPVGYQWNREFDDLAAAREYAALAVTTLMTGESLTFLIAD
jgi:hypothetical protein